MCDKRKQETLSILKSSGLENAVIEEQLGGLQAINSVIKLDNKKYVLKYIPGVENEGQAYKLVVMSKWLISRFIPAPEVIELPSGSYYDNLKHGHVVLMKYKTGHIRHGSTITDSELKEAGRLLASVHKLDVKCAAATGVLKRHRYPNDNHEYQRTPQVSDRVPISDEGEDAIARLQVLKRQTEQKYAREIKINAYNPSVTHGDYHNENILFGPSGAISAILDWEFSSLSWRMCDISKFIDLGCANEGYDDKSIKMSRTFLSGYREINDITEDELKHGLYARYYEKAMSSYFETQAVTQGFAAVSKYIYRDIEKFSQFNKAGAELCRLISAP